MDITLIILSVCGLFIGLNVTLIWRSQGVREKGKIEIDEKKITFGERVKYWSLINTIGFIVPIIFVLIGINSTKEITKTLYNILFEKSYYIENNSFKIWFSRFSTLPIMEYPINLSLEFD